MPVRVFKFTASLMWSLQSIEKKRDWADGEREHTKGQRTLGKCLCKGMAYRSRPTWEKQPLQITKSKKKKKRPMFQACAPAILTDEEDKVCKFSDKTECLNIQVLKPS